MSEATGALVDDGVPQDETYDSFRARTLLAWAKVANDQNWNGQFNTEMLALGYSQDEIDAARDAGKDVHKLTITVRTGKPFNIRNGGYGMSLEDTVASQVRQGFNLGRGDSVTVEHTQVENANA